MPANTRAGVAPSTSLNVELLEGRSLPSAVVPRTTLGPTGDAAATRPTTTDEATTPAPQMSWSYRYHYATGPTRPATPGNTPRVGQSAVYLNGVLVATVQGKPRFAAIGPAASGGSDVATTETGGTTVYVNGQPVGTVYGPVHVSAVGPSVWNRPTGRPVLLTGTAYYITGDTAPAEIHTSSAPPSIWVG